MSMRFCTSCGQGADDAGLKFCTGCGTRLPEPAVAAAPPVVTAVPPELSVSPVPDVPAEPASTVQETLSAIPVAPMEAAPAEPAPAEAAPPAADDGVVIRRTRTSPFLPPPVREDAAPVISRGWAQAQSSSAGPSKLTKQRKMAGDLPDWEPLPPGEVLVRRGTAGGL